MSNSIPGRFFAVGVGPGDPELLTLKAVSILQRADVVYHAGPDAAHGRALDIVRRWLKPEQKLMAVRCEAMREIHGYHQAVEQIAADCRAGRQVVYITEGDPTLYSTASAIWQELAALAPEVPIEVVPGVSSITAAAAKVQWPLAQKSETIAIVPAHYHEAKLRDWIEQTSTAVFLKPAKALPELCHSLGDHDAVYVENVGTERELIGHDLDAVSDRGEYFSLVLVKRRAEGVSPLKALEPRLSIIGIGPGDPGSLTLRASEALRSVDAIVGYDAYLRHLQALKLKAELFGSPIGAEVDRARQALNLAGAGKRVALVSSGDAGVYGMASLVLEMAPADLTIEVIPGITAATAAASLLGAPLGHDFTCISLSDLLTPWHVIERRLAAAAEGDFVIALYNPASQKRTWQLERARQIILKRRLPETPVGIVDRAYRERQSTRLTTLGELVIEGIGMETVLIIGSSQTRIIQGRMVTPRGYSLTSPEEQPPEQVVAEVGAPGREIISKSFAIIERELGGHDLPPWLFAVVRRMIHASADFDYARILRHSPGFEAAFQAAWNASAPIVTDVEMVRLGIASTWPKLTVHCYLNDPATAPLAEAENLSRTAAGIRLAARCQAQPILVIGNAPTALDEALRLIEADTWQPAVIIGLPVGFVGVCEAKERLQMQTRVPYLTCVGRKGGSAAAAAATNALIDWVQHER